MERFTPFFLAIEQRYFVLDSILHTVKNRENPEISEKREEYSARSTVGRGISAERACVGDIDGITVFLVEFILLN